MNEFEKVALLIDADNTQASKTEDIIREVSTYGRIVIKRAYGNWSKPSLQSWESEIKRFAISAIQQFDFASGKNASDMALTIDAMELLYTGKCQDCSSPQRMCNALLIQLQAMKDIESEVVLIDEDLGF